MTFSRSRPRGSSADLQLVRTKLVYVLLVRRAHDEDSHGSSQHRTCAVDLLTNLGLKCRLHSLSSVLVLTADACRLYSCGRRLPLYEKTLHLTFSLVILVNLNKKLQVPMFLRLFVDMNPPSYNLPDFINVYLV